MATAAWENLLTLRTAWVGRRARYLLVDLREPHLVLSTSVRNGGQTDTIRHLVNHQSCEGTGHETRARVITQHGQEAYHDRVCGEVERPPEQTVVMGTAANMNYVAIARAEDAGVEVTALVTAGVESNATCAGDPASWRETREGTVKAAAVAGTINTILLVNTPLVPAALARTVVTMTEGKSAALQRLAVRSRSSLDAATGTGTDQYCIAAPLEGEWRITSASPHMKFGEIVGAVVRDATLEALRWQNGLEPSFTRSLFHALGRYGLAEATIADALVDRLSADDVALLRKNTKAAFYEPLVGAASHALAAVLDRVRHGTLPAHVAREALVRQAATLAASLAMQPERWPAFRERLLAEAGGDPRDLVLAAVALGWSEKWKH